MPQIIEVEESSGSGDAEPLKKVVRPTVATLQDQPPRELGNPVTSYTPNRPRGVFLAHLDVSNAAWDCSCDGIG